MPSTSVKSVAALTALLTATVTAQAPVVGPGQGVGFDYLDADLAAYAVNRFEASWDGAAFVATVWEAHVYADTPPGAQTYRVVPPFAVGTHTVSVRACNTAGCGGGSVPFGFAYAAVDPVSPGGVRVVN